ncbi:GNAT family N-acetyltransferase [Larkinella harenae]
MTYIIEQARPNDALPWNLLLLADENPDLIRAYLPTSLIYLLKRKEEEPVLGVCLLQIEDDAGEIVNIAVEPAFQGKGLGKALLTYATEAARQQGLSRLIIKTGNSGISQIALYQQHGFDLIDVNYNHFLRAYPAPIWENRIQCKHQLIFELIL